jgi:hypothetical protein
MENPENLGTAFLIKQVSDAVVTVKKDADIAVLSFAVAMSCLGESE